MSVRGRLRAVPFILLVAAAGCSAGSNEAVSATDDARIVMRHLEPHVDGGLLERVGGTIEIDGDCLYLTSEGGVRRPVIWPAGTRWDAVTQTLVMPNGIVFGLGAQVVGGGGSIPLEMVGGVAGADAQALASRCVQTESGTIFMFNNSPSEVQAVGQ